MIGLYASIGLIIGFVIGFISTILFGETAGFLVCLSCLILGLIYGYKKTGVRKNEN